MNIEEKPEFATPFEWIGGETRVHALVERFYDLMDLEPAYVELRAVHGPVLDDARQKLFWFLCGWLGGPQHYVERFGHPRLKQRHMPFKVSLVGRASGWLVWARPCGKRLCLRLCASSLRSRFIRRPTGCVTSPSEHGQRVRSCFEICQHPGARRLPWRR